MVTLEQLRTEYREKILALAKAQGVDNIRVFGSVARGEQTEESDVDFLYHRLPGTSLWELGGLHWQLEELLKTEVQLTDEWSVNEHAFPDEREHIFREAVPL